LKKTQLSADENEEQLKSRDKTISERDVQIKETERKRKDAEEKLEKITAKRARTYPKIR